MKKAIIWGINGQDAYYLSEILSRNNIEIIGLGRQHIDIGDFEAVHKLIAFHQPYFIFHLAANSTTRHEALLDNHKTICTGTINILEAVKNSSPHSKVFISGSGLQFVNKGEPIKESDPFDGRDAYSVSRINSVYATRYFRSIGIKAYVGYFFNHDSPRRSERHIAMKIAQFVKQIGNGKESVLEIGDLSVVKEWAFAGDIMEALWLFINQDVTFEMNISNGVGYSIKNWVEVCFKQINKDWTQYIMQNNSYKAEYKSLVSDATLIKNLGYIPKVGFDELAYKLMESK